MVLLSTLIPPTILKLKDLQKIKLNKKLILLITFLLGLITPFIDYFVIVEFFFLLIPFSLIFIITFINLLQCFFNKKEDIPRAIFIFSILPLFLFSQDISGFLVDKIQKNRSEHLLTEIENIQSKTGHFPERYNCPIGINYQKLDYSPHFEISYSRGFMVTETYNSESKSWKSYGWNN